VTLVGVSKGHGRTIAVNKVSLEVGTLFRVERSIIEATPSHITESPIPTPARRHLEGRPRKEHDKHV
jgi:hypothetical protein